MGNKAKWVLFDNDFTKSNYVEDNIPDHTKSAIEDYLINGLSPGSFISAVFANDLHRAAQCADVHNIASLGFIARWVATYAPAGSYGSYDAVDNWCGKNSHYQQFRESVVLKVLTTQ